jgi:predicted esterase
MEVGKHCKQIKRIALIAPPGDFEKHVEVWRKQPYFKHIIAAQPTTPAESGKILNKISALKRISLLKDKQILIGYIENDRIMHSEIAKELVAQLQAANITPIVIEVKGGHNAGLFRYLFNKTYVEFLTTS